MDERYQVNIFWVQDYRFIVLHCTALVFIGLSFICAGFVIITSFKNKGKLNFFVSWSKCERFVIYTATCDILLHIVHCTDHIHMLATRDHVHPIELCEFYSFILYEFTFAQSSLVFTIALNAFLLIKFRIKMNYGARDWRLISLVFGMPFIICIFLVIFKQFGPTGTYCGIVGERVVTFISTLPVLLILTANIILYALTWKHIKMEGRKMTVSSRISNSPGKRSARAAKNMSLFVAAYLLQWWALPVHGLWYFVDNTPFVVLELLAIFTNMGGILNGMVYLIIKKSRVIQVNSVCLQNDGPERDKTLAYTQSQCDKTLASDQLQCS